MRLEYTTEEENALRITDIEAILTNSNLTEKEATSLLIEKQLLEGNVDANGIPTAIIKLRDGRNVIVNAYNEVYDATIRTGFEKNIEDMNDEEMVDSVFPQYVEKTIGELVDDIFWEPVAEIENEE